MATKNRIPKKIGWEHVGLVIILIGAAVIVWNDFAISTLLGVLFVLAMVILAFVGYRRGWGGGKRTAPVSSTGHHRDLWDGAPFRCIHGYPPHKVKRNGQHVCGWPTGHDLNKWPTAPTEEERFLKVPLKP